MTLFKATNQVTFSAAVRAGDVSFVEKPRLQVTHPITKLTPTDPALVRYYYPFMKTLERKLKTLL